MTVDNDRRIRPFPDLHTTNALTSAPNTTRSRTDNGHGDATRRAYKGQNDAPHYAAFLSSLGRAPERTHPDVERGASIAPAKSRQADAAVRAKLDAFRDRFSGPYLVDGRPVRARPMFRMNTGFNRSEAPSLSIALFDPSLRQIAKKEITASGLTMAGLVRGDVLELLGDRLDGLGMAETGVVLRSKEEGAILGVSTVFSFAVPSLSSVWSGPAPLLACNVDEGVRIVRFRRAPST